MSKKQSIKNSAKKDLLYSAWLSSKECSMFVKSCRDRIKARALNQGLDLSEDSLEIGTIWTFLATRQDVTQKVFQALDSGSSTQSRQLLSNYYILHLIDLRRTRQGSMYHSLYRKTRTVLSGHLDFTCVSDRKGTYYALGKNRKNFPVITEFAIREKNYQLLPDPETEPGCSQNEYITSGAVLFYTWASKNFSKTGLIPIKELVAYLMTRPKFNKEILKVVRISEIESFADKDENISNSMDSFPSRTIVCPQLYGIVEPALQDIARAMMDGWTASMAEVFYLNTGREMRLERIAEIMGYKGASGVKYQLAIAHEDIRRSTAAWPLLSPPDLDDNIFSKFLEYVLFFCKQKIKSRNQDQQQW